MSDGWNALELMDESDYQARKVGCILYSTIEEANEARAKQRGYRVNEYEVTREFGGYEEGGWYFDQYLPTGRSIVLHEACDLEDALEVQWAMTAFAEIEMLGERDYWSVIPGRRVVWVCEQHAPERRPATQPHYE